MVSQTRQNQRPKCKISHFRTLGLLVTAFVSLAVLSHPAYAATYYLDANNGSDSNTGTSSAPWKSLAKAINTLQSGDTVILRNGNYGDLTDETKVNRTDWITYRAETGHTPVIGRVNFGRESSTPVYDAYIVLDGLTITNRLRLCSRNYFQIRNCEISESNYGGIYEAVVFSRMTSYVTLENCEIHHGSKGVLVWGDYWNILDCQIYDVAEDGIKGAGGAQSHLLVEGCEIWGIQKSLAATDDPDGYNGYHCDMIQWSASGARDLIFRRNIIRDSSGVQGIFLERKGDVCTDVTIEDNLIYGLNTDSAYVYVKGYEGVTIRHNTLVKEAGEGGSTIRIDDDTAGNNGQAENIHNNITSGLNVEDGSVKNESHNICSGFSGITPSGSSLTLANLSGLFVDFYGQDFRLVEGSRAIDFGDPDQGTETDIAGKARDSQPDAGCYEGVSDGTGNHAPRLESIGSQSTYVSQELRFTVQGSDSDGDSLTYSASSLPTGATFSGQTFTWTPTTSQAGTYTTTFTVSDGSAQDSETVTMTVQQVSTPNTAPVLAGVGNKSTQENQTLSFSVSATDADGDSLTYSASGLPSGAGFSSQSFSWTPSYDQSGTHEMTITVSDGSAQDSETISISVTNVNRAPTLNSVGSQSTQEETLLTFTLAGSDPDGDTVTYSASGLPSGATLSGNTFSWIPSSSQVGSHSATFAVSDGDLQDTETVTLTVTAGAADETAPVVSQSTPKANAIQVPLNNLMTLHITDTGKGVDAESVIIRVDGNVIYQGNTSEYQSDYGQCSRSGSKNDYKFIFQADDLLPFDHLAVVSIEATDLAGNAMSAYSHSFTTEMRAFGNNLIVSGGNNTKSQPVTVGDSNGNIRAVWAAGAEGKRKIYAGTMAAQAIEFGLSVQITTDSADHCNPDIARGSNGALYVVWQDNRNGNWDIYASVSSDGLTWSQPVQVTNSKSDETHPAIVVDSGSPDHVYVTWQDNRNSHWDIYVASSTNSFASTSISRISSDSANQIDPDIAIDGEGTVYVVWTDLRNGQADIYGASSEDTSWTNVPVVTTTSSQTNPAIAAQQDVSIIHLLWTDDAHGDNDIYYAWSNGLPTAAVTGSSIIDDTSGANQDQPTITCQESSKVFGCWQDWRHAINNNGDSDLFMADLESGSAATNVLIGDDSTNSGQSEPAVGIDGYGHPYIVWTDDRDSVDQIYYAGTTFIDPNPLDSKLVIASQGATIGPDPSQADEPEDVSIIVPAGACQSDVRITITKILNPQALPVQCLGSYDFGPSGIEFNQPVTVTIPYHYTGSDNAAKPYWYDSLTGALSQQGITDIKNLVLSSDLNALQFKTTHFTPFYLVVDDPVEAADEGSGGGGCSVSVTGGGSPIDMVVPYSIIVVVMIVLRRRDRKRSNVSSSV